MGFPYGSAGKESTHNAGDLGSTPGLGRSPGGGKGYSLQYSGLKNSMDCIVHGVTKSQTWLSDFHLIYIISVLQISIYKASLVAQTIKDLPAIRETQVHSLGWEDPQEKGMATHTYKYILFRCAQSLRHVPLLATPWIVAHQAPLSMGFSTQVHWSGWPFLPPRELPKPEIEPKSLETPALAGDFFTTEPPGNPHINTH